MRRAIVGTTVLAVLLAGCAQPLPEPTPDAVPVQAGPALGAGQVDRVLADLTAVLDEADAAALEGADLDAEEAEAQLEAASQVLRTRLRGPSAEIRRAQYVLATEGGEDTVTGIPAGVQTVIGPTADAWPRVLMVVTEPPPDLQAPLLLTLVQTEPREQYRLWSWTRLFGGVQMPATMQPTVGSEPVLAEGGTAALSPAEVLEHFLDLLAEGADSAYAEEFTESPLRVRIAEQRKAWREAVGEGSVTETYTAAQSGPWALSTADGGAIVVASFRTVTSLKLVDSTLTIGDETAALLGKDTIKKNLSITWLSTVAFAVPVAGSTDPVTVLGAEHVPVEATGS